MSPQWWITSLIIKNSKSWNKKITSFKLFQIFPLDDRYNSILKEKMHRILYPWDKSLIMSNNENNGICGQSTKHADFEPLQEILSSVRVLFMLIIAFITDRKKCLFNTLQSGSV
jgi:hypothetical protein